MSKPSRGVKNFNPGNLRKSNNAWKGKIKGTDPAFETFSSPEYGIRALAKLICNYHSQGFNTIDKMIDRYAPPHENDTEAYKKFVAKNVGISPDTVVDLDVDLFNLVKSIIHMENGYAPYEDEIIQAGIDLI